MTEDNSKTLMKIALENNLSMEKVFSAYVILGNDLFFLLDLLEGMTIHIPTKTKRMRSMGRNLYLIEYRDEYSSLRKGDTLTHNGETYRVYSKGRKVLGHNFLPVEKTDD